MTKQVDKNIGGRPIHLDFEIDGEIFSFKLKCPMCGSEYFLLATDLSCGGCSNGNCSCICLERLRDVAYEEGVQWVI